MNNPHTTLITSAILAFLIIGCDGIQSDAELPTQISAVEARGVAEPLEGPYPFTGPVFDIAALPDGGILVADFGTIKEIRRSGVHEVTTIPLVEGEGPVGVPAVTFINGLEPIGNGNFFATRSGLDSAVGASLWRGSHGGARLVADIGAFALEHDVDATEGPQWKDHRCEAEDGYTAGPHSNPYHLAALSGSEALIGDAAGNSVLWAKTTGDIDWVALVTPPVDEDGDWLVTLTLDDGTDCYVQPVPTSVAIGPDGAYYVGELTGTTAENRVGQPSPGLSRVWRIEAGARNVLCPSADCQEVIAGLTSVIDVEFGPDGRLYVVEYDQNDWWSAVVLEQGIGGAIKRCDVGTGDCDVVEAGIPLPGAITFDQWDNMWVLENTFVPTVRQVEWQ